jgi:hypothetical protein
MLAAHRSPWIWWLVVGGWVAILLPGLWSGILSFGVYLVGLLIAGLAATVVGIALLTEHGSERRWLAAILGALLPVPLLFL